ncbi:MAG: tetratricopeptide repeat protein [Deltaproteobacteria bacterium]
MNHRVSLVLHREDHGSDELGRIFLGDEDRAEALVRIERYLGPHARLRSAELEDDILALEVDVRSFEDESRTLRRLGREAAGKNRPRAALGHYEEALKLSPWDPEALKALGRLYYRNRQSDAARSLLVRAREVAPGDDTVLGLLAEIAVHDGRRLAARGYLAAQLRIDPGNSRARAALVRLQPEEEKEIRRALRSGGGGE